MSIWMQLLFILLVGLFGWLIYYVITRNPEAFSKVNLEKSFFSVGILTLGLIAFVALLVYLLKHSA